jgi:hopene-associated glycosyltransferase HpnB
VIGTAVTSLARQTFNGLIHIIVIDDGSSDGTAEVARASARAAGALPRFTLLQGTALPSGWTGKLWALSQGIAAAAELGADYLLFSDADICHGPTTVASLVAEADARDRDLVSHMVKLSAATLPERLLIPAFVFFFFKLYPPAWVADPRRKLAAAAGGCILIRPAALARAGGLQAVRSKIIDDCALARAVKDSGGRISLALAEDTRSLRGYGSFSEIGAMISRTAFAQLRHSYLVLAATLLGLFLTYLLPAALLFARDPLLICLGVAALLLMSFCYLPLVRFYGLSPLWSLCLPLIALFYTGAVIHSALQYARGSGGKWKGRVQDA